jgi:hypothetical protein
MGFLREYAKRPPDEGVETDRRLMYLGVVAVEILVLAALWLVSRWFGA